MRGKGVFNYISGAKFIIEKHGINPEKPGIYRGSYGGLITLMAIFTLPDISAGGALRSVTDWAHYKHSYHLIPTAWLMSGVPLFVMQKA